MKTFIFGIFALLIFPALSAAQSALIKGKVTDDSGAIVPFASIYEKGTTKGTSANADGEFRLRVPTGTISLVIKSVGYVQETRDIRLRGDSAINITLHQQVYELQGVSLTAGEDPAYRIIRNAIAKRGAYLNQPSGYSCDVYIKGLQKMLSAPKRFLGVNVDDLAKESGLDSNRRGILYLSESESRYTVKAPNQAHEEMLSSKVSGSNRAFSFNRASDLDVNFYKNYQDWEGLTNRPLVSPIAANAMSFYRYKMIGSTTENGATVFKIQVIAKRKGDPAFGGYVYILDDSWRLYSVELRLTKEANLNFADTVTVKQQFYPVRDDVWVPASVRFDFTGGMFGFRIGGYYTAVYRNYDIDPVVPKNTFKELMKVTKNVNKRDSAYWAGARPVPLTAEEETDYRKKAILAAKRESKPYLDSLDRKNNTFRVKDFILTGGYTHRNRYKKEYIHINSLTQSLFYNTVEGVGIDFPISYTKQIDSARNRYFFLQGKVRYGFATQKLLPSITTTIPLKGLPISFSAGSDMPDLNNLGTMSTFGNTVNSLLYEINRLKLYHKDFVSLGLSKRLGAVSFSGNAEWANREWLPNAADWKIRDRPGKAFTSNNPFVPAADVPLFPENQSFRVNLRATYEFSKKYVTYPTGRYYLPSKYPTLAFNYSKGIHGVLGSDVDYDLLSATLSKSDVRLGMYGRFSFFSGVGKFLNDKQLYYPDYKHFAGNQSLVVQPRINGFQYLPLYTASTPDAYFQLNAEHNFGGLFINRLPLVRLLKLQEVVGFNYLTTPGFKNYKEYSFGLQYLAFRASYGYAYLGGKQVDRGFRVVLSLQ